MSETNIVQQKNVYDVVYAQQGFFEESGSTLKWDTEKNFATQLLTASDFATGIAMKNPASVMSAMTNLSAIGLSLNPATKYAYLVPRDGKICLDISYMGLIKIATDSGAVRWVKAEPVYKNDNFEYKGVNVPPVIDCNPFGDRGEFAGVYCVAKLSDGDVLVGTMSADDIYTIRGKSKAFASGRNCPWKSDFIEMAKKTLIKRESKTWPKSERMMTASDVLNEHEGYREEYLVNPKYEPESGKTVSDSQKTASELKSKLDNDDISGLYDEYTAMDQDEQLDCWQYLDSATRRKIKIVLAEERKARTIEG